MRNTQKGARSLAGQADCSAVTLEGGIPSSNIPHISEFLRNSEMFSYRHQARPRLRPGEMPPTSRLAKIDISLLDKERRTLIFPLMEGVGYIDLERKSGFNIWRLAWPVMISSLLYTFLTMADIFWIGRLGASQVAAASLSGSILGVIISFAQVISAGTLAIVSRYAGAGEKERVKLGLDHSLILALLVALPILLFGLEQGSSILTLLGAQRHVVRLGLPYLRLLFLAVPFLYLGIVASAALYGLGDTRTPMRINIFSTMINVVLDPFLIFGWAGFPRWGMAGAGAATLLSLILNSLLNLRFLIKQGILTLQPPHFHLTLLGKILGIGFPASIASVTRPLTGMVMFRIVAWFGTVGIAAFGIGIRTIGIPFIYLMGLRTATQTLVGQNLGAERVDRAEDAVKKVITIGLLLQAAVTALYFLFAPQIITLFNSDPGVVKMGTSYLRIISVSLLAVSFTTAWGGAQLGAGETKPPMISALLSNWVVKIPLAFLMASRLNWGVNGVWIAIGFSVLVEAIVLGVSYQRGRWKTKIL